MGVHVHVHVCIHVWVCMCMCMCACMYVHSSSMQPPHGVNQEEMFSLVEGVLEELLSPSSWQQPWQEDSNGESLRTRWEGRARWGVIKTRQ